MRFNPVRVFSELDPEKVLATYYASENGNYRIQQSLTSDLWLAFYRTGRSSNEFGLVGPPVETKKAAIDQCTEHSLSLPW